MQRGGLGPTKEAVEYITDRVASKKVLTYYVLETQVKERPDHPFIIFEGEKWSYKRFFEAVIRVGNWLVNDLGIEVEEVV